MEQDLIKVAPETTLAAYSADGGLDPILKEATDLVHDFKHDMSTATSRARTASLAHRVSKFKVKLDDLGKGLTAEWAMKKKAVDSNRKSMRDSMDDLRDEARQPCEAHRGLISIGVAVHDLDRVLHGGFALGLLAAQ